MRTCTRITETAFIRIRTRKTYSPMGPCIALDKEGLLELSSFGRPFLVWVGTVWVIEPDGAILACHEAVFPIA